MFRYKISEILEAIDGKLIKGSKNEILKGVSTDTRKLENEDIFVALEGENFDAHNFINQELANEVKAIVVHKDINCECENIIRVEDTLKALQQMAKFHRANYENVKIIGITGSSGKTSTKDIIYNILKEKYKVKKNEGNLNNHIGVPLTLFRLTGDEDFFIVEMGMSDFGEIKLLAEIANPQIGVITNVGRAHIEFFNSVEEIAQAKGELVESLGSEDLAVLNYDNQYTPILKSLTGKKTKIEYFGFDKKADYHIDDFKYTSYGMDFIIGTKQKDHKLFTNLYGEHNLYNIAAAIAVARNLDIDWSIIKNALKAIKLTGLRSEFKEVEGIKFINDCYNANPLSMKNAIKMLKDIDGNNKIAVLGDMLELGEIKEAAHREVGKYLNEIGIDYLLTTGKLGKYISQAAVDTGMDDTKVIHFADKSEISNYLKKISKKDDVILLKGSRGMQMEVIYQDFIQK